MKAKSKAATLKAKRGRGRPAFNGSPRRGLNGRKSRAKEHVMHDQRETERDALATVTEARMRQALLGHGEIISEDEAKDRLRGFTLGLMKLDGTIDTDELSAGVWYSELASRYYGLTGIPFPIARAQNLFAVGGYDGEVSAEKAKMARDASNRIMSVEGLLLSLPHGRQVMSAVKYVCVADMAESRTWPVHMVMYLRAGLRAIKKAYDCPDWRA